MLSAEDPLGLGDVEASVDHDGGHRRRDVMEQIVRTVGAEKNCIGAIDRIEAQVSYPNLAYAAGP
jgi:hypothetical protein